MNVQQPRAEWPVSPASVGADGPGTKAPRLGVDGAGHQNNQPLLPLAFNEQIEQIRNSRAVSAVVRRRAGQILAAGHTSEKDLEKSIGFILSHVRCNVAALGEIVAYGRMNLPPGTRGECIARIESAAAVLIALWERCQVEVPE